MVTAAAERGYAYYAVTDHAPGLSMHRMTDEKAPAQRERVRSPDGRHHRMPLLHGTELNIGPDGDVDCPAAFLQGFDLCVASALPLRPGPCGDDPADRARLREPPRQRHRHPPPA